MFESHQESSDEIPRRPINFQSGFQPTLTFPGPNKHVLDYRTFSFASYTAHI